MGRLAAVRGTAADHFGVNMADGEGDQADRAGQLERNERKGHQAVEGQPEDPRAEAAEEGLNFVTGDGEYDSVATTSVRVEDFLLDVFREQIIFGRLSGNIDLSSDSAYCLLEGTPPRQSTLRASCENPTVDVFSVTFGTGRMTIRWIILCHRDDVAHETRR